LAKSRKIFEQHVSARERRRHHHFEHAAFAHHGALHFRDYFFAQRRNFTNIGHDDSPFETQDNPLRLSDSNPAAWARDGFDSLQAENQRRIYSTPRRNISPPPHSRPRAGRAAQNFDSTRG